MNRFLHALVFCILTTATVTGCGGGGDLESATDAGIDAAMDGGADERITFPRQMERLGRGGVAVRLGDGEGNYIGWRLLGTDPEEIAFHIYRVREGGEPLQLTETPISETTDFVDSDGTVYDSYIIRAVVSGVEVESTAPVAVLTENYKRIAFSEDYALNRVAVGDLNGDGEYDYVIIQPNRSTDPGVFSPPDETYKLEAYLGDGTFLWRCDLGWNIVQGLWWSPFLVYDLDGDGKAEVATKTAPGDEDYRDEAGRVLTGEEWLSILDGETGEERARGNWIPRRDVSDWGDSYGNRVNRNKLAMAYLDGRRPALIVFRGIYQLMMVEAWQFRDGRLSRLWRWEHEEGGGFRDVQVGDLDGDGFDEIVNGSMAIDHDGSDMWNTGEGGGDRSILAEIDLDRPGLEIWYCQDHFYQHPYHLRDAGSGALIWGDPWWELWDDPLYRPNNGRSVVADLDPASPGQEMWSLIPGNLFGARGESLGPGPDSRAYAVFWDGDLLREVVENGVVAKYEPATGLTTSIATGVEENYAERFIGDLFGDWREELIYTVPGEMRIYTTTSSAKRRLYTFMHDPLYRNGIAMSASGWLPNGHPGFFVGASMAPPPRPNLQLTPLDFSSTDKK